ncbi:DUF397 domain-containing protein [Streptomyces sp. NPDC046261]|uniref:DUF397 domain-containing protein n=1 Tax=Streptomyces sp. NPDC046261 TaxID=3157200 RepID=UPI0034118D87
MIAWQKSSYSADAGNCLNIATAYPDVRLIRESDDPDAILTVTPAALHGLIRAAKAGRFS